MKIVGVTKCPTGIAHTYMAAERLEKTAAKLGYEIKVETQGSQGTENKLTRKEIAKADFVIIAADVSIDEPERFNGKKVFKTRIKPVLKNTENIFERLEEEYFIMGGIDAVQEHDLKDSDAENAGNMIEKRIYRYIRTAYEWCILYDSVCSCRRSARIIIIIFWSNDFTRWRGCFSWDMG